MEPVSNVNDGEGSGVFVAAGDLFIRNSEFITISGQAWR